MTHVFFHPDRCAERGDDWLAACLHYGDQPNFISIIRDAPCGRSLASIALGVARY
jgi:hypothetical protein